MKHALFLLGMVLALMPFGAFAASGIPVTLSQHGTPVVCTNCSGGGSSYTLPPATASTLGGVKVGTGLAATSDGTVSIDLGSIMPMKYAVTFAPPDGGGQSSPFAFLTMGNSYGDNMSLKAQVGYFSTNTFIFDGGNHQPVIALWLGSTQLNFATLSSDQKSISLPSPITFENAPVVSALTGTGNGFACLDATGKLYRSATACQ